MSYSEENHNDSNGFIKQPKFEANGDAHDVSNPNRRFLADPKTPPTFPTRAGRPGTNDLRRYSAFSMGTGPQSHGLYRSGMPTPLPPATAAFPHIATSVVPTQDSFDRGFEKTGFFELLLLNIVDVDALRQTTIGIIDPRDVFLIKTHQAFAFERGANYFENDTYLFLNKMLAQPAAFTQNHLQFLEPQLLEIAKSFSVNSYQSEGVLSFNALQHVCEAFQWLSSPAHKNRHSVSQLDYERFLIGPLLSAALGPFRHIFCCDSERDFSVPLTIAMGSTLLRKYNKKPQIVVGLLDNIYEDLFRMKAVDGIPKMVGWIGLTRSSVEDVDYASEKFKLSQLMLMMWQWQCDTLRFKTEQERNSIVIIGTMFVGRMFFLYSLHQVGNYFAFHTITKKDMLHPQEMVDVTVILRNIMHFMENQYSKWVRSRKQSRDYSINQCFEEGSVTDRKRSLDDLALPPTNKRNSYDSHSLLKNLAEIVVSECSRESKPDSSLV